MNDQIKTGAILIEKGTVVPDSLSLERTPYSTGWESLRNVDRPEMDRELHRAGWTFFFLADQINGAGVGFDEQKAVRAVVKRLLSSVKSRCLNCLEVRQVVTKTFLGLHLVSVFAHPRHIQKSPAPSTLSTQ